jgi:transcriptional regulator with AAA-type ATPase domain/tetratricopeptide (TPR) repeat protein
LLGQSAPLVVIREQVERLLQRHAGGARRLPPLLILGETGTGKGLLAGAIHRAGPRAAAPFVDVNCAAIPEPLIEAELFGFERGAFTDARQAKPGLFQAAHRGTIFLDEVGLLPEGLQAKLLKVLEERAVRRLGSTRSESVDVWVIAATSEDLAEAVRAHRFREDLYHRLAVVTLVLPPLRERGDDIVRLAEHFLTRACEDYGLAPRTLAPDAVTALQAYPWPGNVRELANMMERVALLVDGIAMTAAMLGLPTSKVPHGPAPSAADERRLAVEAQAEAERSRLLEALRATAWNLSRAAARLGIPRNTLRYRMDKLGLGFGSATLRMAGAAPAGAPVMPVPGEPPGDREVSDPSRPPAASPGSPTPATVHWEVRRVTLLSASLVASRAESGSSESSRTLDLVVEKVRSFGGRVEELGTTGLIAAFGLEPVDDTPRHAASAALAIQKVATPTHRDDPTRPPAVTLAFHTELLAVGRHHGDVEIDADAKHRAYALLKTLGDQAEPGAVIVSSQAAGALARRFELTRIAPGRGVTEEVYRLVAASDADRGLTGLVGREAELRLLRDRFDRARAGQGQVVSVVGEAGIGKSRLLRELRRQLAGDVTWMEGHAISFGRTQAFYPLIDLLRRAFELDDVDHAAVVAEKVEHAILHLGEDLQTTLPCVRYLLLVDPGDPTLLQLDPKLRRAEVFDAMRTLFVRAAERRPLVLVWEDLHWSDQATEEFLALLGDTVVGHRILMIVTYRPGYTPPVGDRTFHTRVALPALTTADSVAMALGWLSVDALPDALQTLLVRRAEGNPFFVEEVLRSLRETGAIRVGGSQLALTRDLAEILIPDTVQDVILGRIQRLKDAPRQLLELASVIGRDFHRRLIDHLAESPEATEQALRELKTVELIYEKSLFPELTYTFKHALTQEVAYASLAAPRRSELHRRVGLAIEELDQDRLAERLDVLAYHFARAEDWSKALEYLQKAAKKAWSAFAVREAFALSDEALRVVSAWGTAGASQALMDIRQARGTMALGLGDFARSRTEAMELLTAARQAGARGVEGAALAAMAQASLWLREFDRAVEYAWEAIEVARPIDARSVLAEAHNTIAAVRGVVGRLDEAREEIEQAITLSRSADDPFRESMALGFAGLLRNWEGDFVAATALGAESLRLAQEHHLLMPSLLGFWYQGMALTGRGKYEEARGVLEQGLALAERVGAELHRQITLNCLGWLYMELGDLERGLVLNRESAAGARKRADAETLAHAELNVADVFLAKGDLVLAREVLDGVHRLVKAPTTSDWLKWRYSTHLFASLAELWLARGEPGRAREFADQCLDLATRTSSRKNLVKAWCLRGEIALAGGQPEDAEGALQQALAMAEAIGNPTQLWKTHVAWGRFYAISRRPKQAGQAYRAARAVLDRVKASLQDPALRASLDQARDVRQVYELAASADAQTPD